MRCLSCPPLGTGTGAPKGVRSRKISTREKMSGRNYAKEAAVAPVMSVGPMNGGAGPTSGDRTGRFSDSPLESFLEPAA